MENLFATMIKRMDFRRSKAEPSQLPALILLGIFITVIFLSFMCAATCVEVSSQSDNSHAAACGQVFHSYVIPFYGLIAASILPLIGFLLRQRQLAVLPDYITFLFKPPRFIG